MLTLPVDALFTLIHPTHSFFAFYLSHYQVLGMEGEKDRPGTHPPELTLGREDTNDCTIRKTNVVEVAREQTWWWHVLDGYPGESLLRAGLEYRL